MQKALTIVLCILVVVNFLSAIRYLYLNYKLKKLMNEGKIIQDNFNKTLNKIIEETKSRKKDIRFEMQRELEEKLRKENARKI